jgi:hypothetical protein
MATVDDLADVAEAFLAAAVTSLSVTPTGAPARRYVSPGEPALDCCGQLTVWTQTLDDAALAAGQGALARPDAIRRGTQPQVSLFIQITRCADITPAKVDSLPDPAKLQDAAVMVDQDGWAMRCGMMFELRHGDLANLCSGAEFLGAQKLVPQGGCVGWTFSYRYPIEGGIITT